MEDLTYRLPQTRTVAAESDGTNHALDARRVAAVPRAVTPGLPGYVVDADGGVLVDAEGNSYIDFASGIAVTSVGVSNPRVSAAVADAAQGHPGNTARRGPRHPRCRRQEHLLNTAPRIHPRS